MMAVFPIERNFVEQLNLSADDVPPFELAEKASHPFPEVRLWQPLKIQEDRGSS